MPFFKKKEDRSGRIEELQAHVRNIRRIASEDPKGAGALQSFLIEDGYWDSKAAALEAMEELENPVQQKQAPPHRQPPGHSPEANVVTAETVEHVAPRSEDEAVLEAELERYLARIAEETEPDPDSTYDAEEEQ